MENENIPEKPLKGESRQGAKLKNKKNKQATVLKQLNNQNLYPLQERIGIYVIAVLSTIGLILISYTGVMALVSGGSNGADSTIDININDVYNILDELSDLDALSDETEEVHQDPDELHQYAQPDEDTDVPETEDIETEPSSEDSGIGVINQDMVRFWREPDVDDLLLLHTDYEVIIVELDYNAFWSLVEFESDAITGEPVLWQGYVRREFIDVE